jgi:hypothetical protein
MSAAIGGKKRGMTGATDSTLSMPQAVNHS